MFKTIIVALDCTENERLLAALDSLLIAATAKVILTHVLSEGEEETRIDRPHPNREMIEDRLRSYQSRIRVASDIEVTGGDPAEEIVRLANIYQADLVVIGTRGLTGVKRVIEGSVSGQVVADAPCSVFVVKLS